jgi:hypothetical protein
LHNAAVFGILTRYKFLQLNAVCCHLWCWLLSFHWNLIILIFNQTNIIRSILYWAHELNKVFFFCQLFISPFITDKIWLRNFYPEHYGLKFYFICTQYVSFFIHINDPFALFSENLQLLRQRYYYATWKADGTRYMMLIMRDGCFLIDRNFCFRRVQMRFPHKSLEVKTSFVLAKLSLSMTFSANV